MTIGLVVLGVWSFVMLCVLAMCRAAAHADRQSEAAPQAVAQSRSSGLLLIDRAVVS